MNRDQCYEAMKKKLLEMKLPQKDYERLIRKLESWLDEVYSMNDLEVYALENRYPEVRAIESGASGLKYLVDGDNRGIIISGMRGMTGLDIRQAKALAAELPGILEGMGYSV